MKQLSEALSRFVQQQNLYNEAYGLFQNHDIQPRMEKISDCWDSQIPVSPELEYLYSHYEMIDAKAAGTHKLKNAAVEIGDAAVLFLLHQNICTANNWAIAGLHLVSLSKNLLRGRPIMS
uniref:Uncharacterized protein n=1 Tax=Paenibacillus polymyxa TaxID=1406 RepID=A0AAE9PRY7_PAEPO